MENPIIASVFSPIIGPYVSLTEVLCPYWIVLLIAFLVSLIAVPIARKAAFRFNILDLPDATVKTHSKPTAYLGGAAVLVGFLVAIVYGQTVLAHEMGSTGLHLPMVALGATCACILGVIDDVKDLKPSHKLIGQAVCSLFLVLAGIKPDLHRLFAFAGINLPDYVHDVLAYFILLLFVLGASNSLNLLDGLDGLCTGVTAIITLGFLLLAIHLATWGAASAIDQSIIVIGLALFGSAVGFLVFNRHPAKIFLGDGGSVMLGFLIATMMMLFASRHPRWWFASVVIFGLPILDTGTALIRRALNNRPLFVSDRGHIYDQMIDRGMPLQKTVAINYLLAAFYALAGLAIAVFMRTRYAIIPYILIAAVSFGIVGYKGYFRMVGLRGVVPKENQQTKDDHASS